MIKQTTSRPEPQPDRRRADRADTVTLILGAIAAAVVMACADAPGAVAYRAAFAQLVGLA